MPFLELASALAAAADAEKLRKEERRALRKAEKVAAREAEAALPKVRGLGALNLETLDPNLNPKGAWP